MIDPEALVQADSTVKTFNDLLPVIVENNRRANVNAERLRGLQEWVNKINSAD